MPAPNLNEPFRAVHVCLHVVDGEQRKREQTKRNSYQSLYFCET